MKTLAAIVTAAVLSLPGLAAAECEFPEQHVQISCAEGLVYDSATRTCVQPTG